MIFFTNKARIKEHFFIAYESMKPFYTSIIKDCNGQREIIIVVLDHIFKNGNKLQNLIIVHSRTDLIFVIFRLL
jgi:hypothetical protein